MEDPQPCVSCSRSDGAESKFPRGSVLATLCSAAGLLAVLLGLTFVLLARPASGQTANAASNPLEEMSRQFSSEWAKIPADTAAQRPSTPLRIVRPGLFAHIAPVLEVASPDGRRAAGTENGNLYVRPIEGEAKVLALADAKGRWDLEGAVWSGDGTMLALKKIDDANVPRITLTGDQFKPTGVAQVPYSRIGEPLPKHRVAIVDTRNGKINWIHHGSNYPYVHIVGWREDSRELRLLRSDRYHEQLQLIRADVLAGRATVLLTEQKPVSVVGLNMLHGRSRALNEQKIVAFLPDNSFIWTSDRSGYRHLYYYDAHGRLLRALTNGQMEGWVDRLLTVDVPNRYLYAIANGHAPNPYDQQLVRVSLDKRNVLPIAEGPFIPEVRFSADKTRLWVVQGGFPEKSQIVEFTNGGQLVKTVWRADWTALRSTGFTLPEMTNVLGADGKTLLSAMIFKPSDFRSDLKYPVIQEIYGSPHRINLPLSYRHTGLWWTYQLAQHGFIVVMLDGRGTPGRGRDFQNFGYGRFGQVEFADHVAGLRNLGKDRPYMNLSRVGVAGSSWGGYFGLRTLLQTPGLYKAAVFGAGAFELSSMRVSAEPYMGCAPQTCPGAYARGSNIAQLHRLNAPLLLIHGTADDDVPLTETEKLVRALAREGKPFEFVPVPGANHAIRAWPEYEARTVSFFRKHLGKPLK